jgi:hypothetical protein
MPAPLVAIVGGADPARIDLAPAEGGYDEKVHLETANEMAVALGAEFARRGWRIMVYHAGGAYIEARVVEGFVSATSSRERSVIIRQPHAGVPSLFNEEKSHPGLFSRRVDTSDEWEVSFYRSLAEADAVVLIGGGYSTFTAGQVAIGSRIPILALEQSGGAARKVWRTLSPDVDLPTSEEHARMAHALSAETVRDWVAGLDLQRRRRYAVETGPIVRHAIFSGLLFVLAMALALTSHLIAGSARLGLAKGLLLASTLFGGGAGAAIRMVFERRYGTGPLVPPSLAVTLALGTMAGGLAGLLYLVAQTSATDPAADATLRLVAIMTVISVVGGLTVETVFRKLLGVDVTHTTAIAARPDSTTPAAREPQATK